MSVALKQRGGGGGVTFVEFNGKTGTFVHRDSGSKEKTAFNQIENVHLEGLKFKEDEYQGEKIPKAQIYVRSADDNELICITANLQSLATTRLLALVNGAADNPGKPLTLNAMFTAKGDKLANGELASSDFVWVSAKQGGEKVPFKFDTPDNVLPKLEKVRVNGKEVTDMTPIYEIAADLFEKIGVKLNAASQTDAPTPAGEEVDPGDLPDAPAARTGTAPRG